VPIIVPFPEFLAMVTGDDDNGLFEEISIFQRLKYHSQGVVGVVDGVPVPVEDFFPLCPKIGIDEIELLGAWLEFL